MADLTRQDVIKLISGLDLSKLHLPGNEERDRWIRI